MAVAFRSADGTDGGTATSISLNKPSGTVDNDAMLAVIYIELGSSDPPTGMTDPSGWNRLVAGIANSSFWLAVYSKKAASEGASWTWSWTTSAYCSGHVASFSGGDTTNPFHQAALGTATTGSTVTYPSVTTSVADTMIVGLVTAWSAGESAPATFSTAHDPGTYSGAIYYKAFAGPGAFGTYTGGVTSGAEGAIAATVAIKPPDAAAATSSPPIYIPTRSTRALLRR